MSYLQNRKTKQAAARRHSQLLRTANDVVSRGSLDRRIADLDPALIVALAFGRYELRVTDEEAIDYLNAALAERGFPLRYTDCPVEPSAGIPAQRDGQDGDDQ